MKQILYWLLKILFCNKSFYPPIETNDVKKLLILRFDAAGDMLITTPVFELIKKRLPKVELDVLCSLKNYNIIKHNPDIHKVYITNNRIMNILKILFQLRKNYYDIIVGLVFNKTTKSGLIANLISRKNTIKVSITHSKRSDLYSILFNVLINIDDIRFKKSIVESQIVLISRLFGWDYNPEDINLRIYLDNNDEYKGYLENKTIFYNISAGGNERTISTEQNIRIIKKLIAEHQDYSILLHASPKDYHKVDDFKRVFLNRIKYLPSIPNILDICKIISNSDIVVSPDTSIIHIAATYKKKVYILLPNHHSILKEWLPYRTEYELINVE